jgi:hypothetical protein
MIHTRIVLGIRRVGKRVNVHVILYKVLVSLRFDLCSSFRRLIFRKIMMGIRVRASGMNSCAVEKGGGVGLQKI